MTTTSQSLTPTRLEDIESSSYVEYEYDKDEGRYIRYTFAEQNVDYEFPDGIVRSITILGVDQKDLAVTAGVELFIESEETPIATGPLMWGEVTDALAQWMWSTGNLENRVVHEIVLDQNKATRFWFFPEPPVAPSPSEHFVNSRGDRCPCCGRIYPPEPAFEDWVEVRARLA